MSNTTALFSLECQIAQERDGFQDAVRFLRGWAPPKFPGDTLTVFRTNTSAATDIVTNAAVRPVLISVNSPATATTDAWLNLFNTSSASVTLGGLPKATDVFKVPYTKSTTVVLYTQDGDRYNAALSMAVTTSPHGGTAADATNAPVITILYG